MKASKRYMAAANIAAHVGVNIQPKNIVEILDVLTARVPFVRPTPITAPTIACDVDTGIPSTEKKCTPAAADNWAANAPE